MDRFPSRLIGLVLGFLVMVLFGCASTPQTRFFVLSSISGSEKMGNREGERCFAIGIAPVKIPEYLDQPEIVTRITENEVRVDEFARWAEPSRGAIFRAPLPKTFRHSFASGAWSSSPGEKGLPSITGLMCRWFTWMGGSRRVLHSTSPGRLPMGPIERNYHSSQNGQRIKRPQEGETMGPSFQHRVVIWPPSAGILRRRSLSSRSDPRQLVFAGKSERTPVLFVPGLCDGLKPLEVGNK